MHCPFCGDDNIQVKDSRPAEAGASIRRRRQCLRCDGRFTTFERVELRPLTVVKRQGGRVPFDRDKLARSVRVAARKRPIDPDRLEALINGVVRGLERRGDGEVTSQALGEAVMRALAKLDAVAFVRFASVYRNFTDVQDFERFIAALRPTSAEASDE